MACRAWQLASGVGRLDALLGVLWRSAQGATGGRHGSLQCFNTCSRLAASRPGPCTHPAPILHPPFLLGPRPARSHAPISSSSGKERYVFFSMPHIRWALQHGTAGLQGCSTCAVVCAALHSAKCHSAS